MTTCILFAEDELTNTHWLDRQLLQRNVPVLAVILRTRNLSKILSSAEKAIFVLSEKLLLLPDIANIMDQVERDGKFIPVKFDSLAQLPAMIAGQHVINLSSYNPLREDELEGLVKLLQF
jgi:hypothetical protein